MFPGHHAGPQARLHLTQRLGRVVAVHPGEGRRGAPASEWQVDLEDSNASPQRRVMVLGGRRPNVGEWGLWGAFAGDGRTCWFLPGGPMLTASAEAMRGHVGLADFGAVLLAVAVDGRCSLTTAEGEPRVVVAPDGGLDDGPSVALLAGDRRMARLDDVAVVNAQTSPAFATWVASVTAALNTLAAVIAPLTAAALALDAQVRALAPAYAGPPPPLPPALAPVSPPSDALPSVDGAPAQPAAGVQLVARIATGSQSVRGQ